AGRSSPAHTAAFPGCGITRQTSAASRVARGSSGPAAPVMSAIPIGPRTEEGALPGPPAAGRPRSAGRGPHPQPRPVEAGGPFHEPFEPFSCTCCCPVGDRRGPEHRSGRRRARRRIAGLRCRPDLRRPDLPGGQHHSPGPRPGHQVADGHPRRRGHPVPDHRRGPLRCRRRRPRRGGEGQVGVQVRRRRLRPGRAGPDRRGHPQVDPRGRVAMGSWIKDIVAGLVDAVLNTMTSATMTALNWVLGLLSATVFTSPDVTGLPQVRFVAGDAQIAANAAMVLVVMVAGILAMTHGSVQDRYTIKELLPRLVIGFAAANLSAPIVSGVITAGNALTQSMAGHRFNSADAFNQIKRVITDTTTDPSMFLVALVLRELALWM